VIVAPLRGPEGVSGVLTLERLGSQARFNEEEFELIQLFAGHVSIALHNALAHRAVEIRAQTDALTNLKNHGALQHILSQAVGRGLPFSLLIVDLDDFKAFNDRRGHEAGNALLRAIARALEGSCREMDQVFRYGGDEFALVLPGTDERGALVVAEKVRHAIQVLSAPGSRRPTGVTCSIGVASYPSDATDRAGLLLAADRACYVVKRDGRNRAATAAEGLALAAEFLPQPPTPVDEAGPSQRAA
jgi:diguanylate cyclase (GGDEF)-like protein